MTKTLNDLRKQMKPEVQAAASEKAAIILAEMSLSEARKMRGKRQVELAHVLGIAQPNVSQIEKRPDTMISTLSSYIEALGGTLELRAKFPDGNDVEIVQFKRATRQQQRDS
ncbi:transcriptional regulator [Pseudidiomarina aestuarii]|uniref:Transcriptional regulator n=1 Tax=Pseudidiomarina aestuarii TaxID=624146 RepID=A0A2T4D4I4_9GAMM|nr:transcriptional regulator [Pseudidiomarina aestuarii]PTB85393.1 transcriptional regulator [Pseudidiomarina aestuarii]PTB88717.1 transcriptional regulator [Pseudidiomarina aestuarii]